jgi:hypothetical protein
MVLLQVWRESFDTSLLALCLNDELSIKETLHPLCLSTAQVTSTSFKPHDFARARYAESFGCSFVSLDLRH